MKRGVGCLRDLVAVASRWGPVLARRGRPEQGDAQTGSLRLSLVAAMGRVRRIGNSHVSCLDQRSERGTMHATCSRGNPIQWQVEQVTTQGGAYTSIALDSDDDIHIAYVAGGALKYATTR